MTLETVPGNRLLNKARPEQTSMPTTSSPRVTLPYPQCDWIDVEPGKYDTRLNTKEGDRDTCCVTHHQTRTL